MSTRKDVIMRPLVDRKAPHPFRNQFSSLHALRTSNYPLVRTSQPIFLPHVLHPPSISPCVISSCTISSRITPPQTWSCKSPETSRTDAHRSESLTGYSPPSLTPLRGHRSQENSSLDSIGRTS